MPRRHSALRHGSVAGKRHEPGDHSAAVPDTVKGQYSHISHRLSALLGMLTVNALARRQQDHSPRPGGVSARQGPGAAAVHHQQGQATAEPQAPDRRHPADDGGQPYQLCQGDRRPAARNLRQQNQGVWHRDSPSVRAKEISAEGKSIFAHDPNGKSSGGLQKSD